MESLQKSFKSLKIGSENSQVSQYRFATSQRQEKNECCTPEEVFQSFQEREKKIPGGLWPKGEIYYKLDPSISKSQSLSTGETQSLSKKVEEAIKDWNKTNFPHCQFIETIDAEYFVTFLKVSKGNPRSCVGCLYSKSQYIELPERYSNGPPVRKECILHEMMHCAGFSHEHSRPDRDYHCEVFAKEDDVNYSIKGNFQIGSYDYRSLMHYGEIPGELSLKTEELKKYAGRPTTFSIGDRTGIKILYSPAGTHHGKWHKPCDPNNCTEISCGCGNCGPVEEDEVNCGFHGSLDGHWTCCMSTKYDSKCKIDHTGFWHGKCYDSRCTPTDCYCNNCGRGCTHIGTKGHWSCCNIEDFKAKCSQSFKKLLSK